MASSAFAETDSRQFDAQDFEREKKARSDARPRLHPESHCIVLGPGWGNSLNGYCEQHSVYGELIEDSSGDRINLAARCDLGHVGELLQQWLDCLDLPAAVHGRVAARLQVHLDRMTAIMELIRKPALRWEETHAARQMMKELKKRLRCDLKPGVMASRQTAFAELSRSGAETPTLLAYQKLAGTTMADIPLKAGWFQRLAEAHSHLEVARVRVKGQADGAASVDE